jgi:hypothetical protein
LAALVTGGSAGAHETGSHTGFLSTVSYIEPPLPGLLVRVIGGHERLSVANLTEKNVIILDGQGGPLVRIAPHRTEVWSEPRVGSEDAPPEQEGFVRNWHIRGTADGEPFAIVGFLGYRPPPGTSRGNGGLPTWAVVLLGAGGALVLVGALAVPFLLRERKNEGGVAADR